MRAQELIPVGAKVDETQRGLFEGLRAAGDGFACDVHHSELWVDHYRANKSFIVAHRTCIREAIELGADVAFDVAVDEEDQAAQ